MKAIVTALASCLLAGAALVGTAHAQSAQEYDIPEFSLSADGVVDYGYIPGDRFELKPEHAANPQLFATEYPLLAQRLWAGAQQTPTAGVFTHLGQIPVYLPVAPGAYGQHWTNTASAYNMPYGATPAYPAYPVQTR